MSQHDAEVGPIAAIVPCYRTGPVVLDVIAAIGGVVDRIFVVDDHCPDGTGALVRQGSDDPRVEVLELPENRGVGGATMAGYERAVADGYKILVKVDGDGQMDPALIPGLVRPIQEHRADYVKGNRFFDLEALRAMPLGRKIGNAGLSFLTKMSSGYWHVMDPTNGFTAVHAGVISLVPLDRVDQRFFFESDLLFRLGTLDAVVLDAPMVARYGEEESNLRPAAVLGEFLLKNVRNASKRLVYNYFLRGFSLASLELLLGAALIVFGAAVGLPAWLTSLRTDSPATAGTVMLAGLPVFLGFQLLLSFLSADLARRSDVPLHLRLTSLMPDVLPRAPGD